MDRENGRERKEALIASTRDSTETRGWREGEREG